MTETRTEPHVSVGVRSPLSSLIESALREWGSGNPQAVDGNTVHMMLGFANQVIQEVNSHPYFYLDAPLDFYTDVREVRDVADLIIKAGLLHYYALQQASQRTQVFGPAYYRMLNSILWNEANGNTKIQMRPMDLRDNTSALNGQPESE